MDFLFRDVDFHRSYLDYLKVKNRVILSNLANAETPFYKRLEVELQKIEYQIPLKTTSEKHLSNVSKNPFAFKIEQDKNGPFGEDGNNVSVERELVDLEKVAIKYETVLKFIQGKMGALDLVIKGLSGG